MIGRMGEKSFPASYIKPETQAFFKSEASHPKHIWTQCVKSLNFSRRFSHTATPYQYYALSVLHYRIPVLLAAYILVTES